MEHRICEAEQAEKCQKHRQRDEEAENWDPEHDNQDEDELEIKYSDDEGDTIVSKLFVSSEYLLTSGKVYFLQSAIQA